MIQLKEINPKEFMKGTKMWRFQVYLWLGLVGFTAAFSAPLIYLYGDKALLARQENIQKREDQERETLQQIAKVYEALQQQQTKNPSNKP